MSGTVEVERRDRVAVITLANPKKKNALDPPMLDALGAALAALPAEGARAVVLTGAGDVFSSGYDLAALPAGAAAPGPSGAAGDAARSDTIVNPLERALSALLDGPLPVVAALNGAAIGGGCELAATCDLRVAHEAVTLTMPPVRLGLVYSPTGLRRFVALCGISRTRELFLTAQPVAAARALGWGLVDRVVAPEAVLATALELATQMSCGAPLAVAGTRRMLELLQPSFDAAAAEEMARLIQRAWRSEDAAEARAAFRDKRKPEFKGR